MKTKKLPLIKSWIEKLFGIHSPSAHAEGFDYMYDLLTASKKS